LAWTVEFTSAASRQLRRLDQSAQQRIAAYLRAVLDDCDDPRQRGKGLIGPLAGFWRYRVGDHRILCRLDQGALVVLVVEVGHRSEIYGR